MSRSRPRRSLAVLLTVASLAWSVGPATANHAGPPSIFLDPSCGAARGGTNASRYDIFVYGERFGDDPVRISFAGVSDPDWVAWPDKDGVFFRTINPEVRPAGSYLVEAVEDNTYYEREGRPEHEASASFSVPCPSSTTTAPPTTAPTTVPDETTAPGVTETTVTATTTTTAAPPPATPSINVTPAVAPAGMAVRVQGAGFPPGPVSIALMPGFGRATAVVAPDGTFSAPLVVLPRSVRGAAAIIATAGPVTAAAPFVVAPGTVQPGDFAYRN